MVDISYFCIANHTNENVKLAENKKCPIQGLLPDGLIVSIYLTEWSTNLLRLLCWYYIKLGLKSQYQLCLLIC